MSEMSVVLCHRVYVPNLSHMSPSGLVIGFWNVGGRGRGKGSWTAAACDASVLCFVIVADNSFAVFTYKALLASS